MQSKFGKLLLGVSALVALVCLAHPSRAEDPRPPPPSRAFQMAVRTGYAVPGGRATSPDVASDILGNQGTVLLEIGGKTSGRVFLGGYLGFGHSGAGGSLRTTCNQRGWSCDVIGGRAGGEVIIYGSPWTRVNPWFGYGFGYEQENVMLKAQNRSNFNVIYHGIEYARLSLGLDYRATRVFGLGPYFEYSVGQFGSTTGNDSNGKPQSASIGQPAPHHWIGLGARFVVFP